LNNCFKLFLIKFFQPLGFKILAELREFAAKEKLEIVNFRGGAAHFCPAVSEPREARRGNSV